MLHRFNKSYVKSGVYIQRHISISGEKKSGLRDSNWGQFGEMVEFLIALQTIYFLKVGGFLWEEPNLESDGVNYVFMADSLNSLWFGNFITLFIYSVLISDSTLLAFIVLDIYDVTSFIDSSRAVRVSFSFNTFCFRYQI